MPRSGAAGNAVDGIGGGGIARVEVSERGGGEVAAGGGADDADASGVELPGGGLGADGAEGALGVVEHGGVAVAGGAQAVFEDEGGDALLV